MENRYRITSAFRSIGVVFLLFTFGLGPVNEVGVGSSYFRASDDPERTVDLTTSRGEEIDLRKWIVKTMNRIKSVGVDKAFAELVIPGPEDAESQIQVLIEGIRDLDGNIAKNICMKALFEKFPTEAKGVGLKLLRDHEVEPEVQVVLLHLLAIYRTPDAKELMIAKLDHENAEVRAAAIDAIAILSGPSYPLNRRDLFRPQSRSVQWRFPIHVDTLIEQRGWNEFNDGSKEMALGKELKAKLHQRLHSSDPNEREAAARMMVKFPPDNYQLRVAEWGVWINDDGKYQLVETVLDEIPRFVHRTQNRLDDLKDRINSVMIVTKPIIHVTVDRPMSLDIRVSISQGQPWFAFPKPNDFWISISGDPGKEMDFRNREIERLLKLANSDESPIEFADASVSYPWLVQPLETFGSFSGGMGQKNVAFGIGLIWQNVIALPKKPSWMKLEEIAETKFEWWQRLREVESSWVSSRGDSERYLYYDGPTNYPCKYSAKIEREYVSVAVEKDFQNFEMQNSVKSKGLYVSVDENGVLAGHLFSIDSGPGKIPEVKNPGSDDAVFRTQFSIDGSLSGDEVKEAFRSLIESEDGLNKTEADGMIDVWDAEFFRRPGKRVLFLMDRPEYDRICPISVRPAPSELRRVGIVLANLSE